uniref:IQ motif containing C n=1 Tax=Oncorhynchus kisutch TaxID=8019 RepID=A0A8C7FAW1_ONCKI
MRKEINCARSEFEDIVRDIDGEVNHLEWKGHIIAIPHFKDVSILRFQIKCNWMVCHSLEDRKFCFSFSAPFVYLANVIVLYHTGWPIWYLHQKTCGRSTRQGKDFILIVFRACKLMTCSKRVCLFPGSQRWRSLAQDESHTPEALQLHRNTLAMEMLWLQQAIASRKKYLSLKESLNIS